MKSKSVLVAVGLALAIASAQSTPKEGEERSRAEVYAPEWFDQACSRACCLGVQTTGQWLYEERERSPAEVYALEGFGALFAATPCVCVGVMALLAVHQSRTVALCVASVSAVCVPAATGFGAIGAGHRLGESGSRGWAVGGAYAGVLLGVGIGACGYMVSQSNAVRIPACVLGGLAIPTGAVVGYNVGAPSRSHIGSRLELPAVALTSTRLPDHSVEYGARVQLTGVRF